MDRQDILANRFSLEMKVSVRQAFDLKFASDR